jgi:hypothetical protein
MAVRGTTYYYLHISGYNNIFLPNSGRKLLPVLAHRDGVVVDTGVDFAS